jgi:hypothetical protein
MGEHLDIFRRIEWDFTKSWSETDRQPSVLPENYETIWVRGKFGDIVFVLEPADEVDGKAPVHSSLTCKRGNVPKEYILLRKDFRSNENGPEGYQVDILKVTL